MIYWDRVNKSVKDSNLIIGDQIIPVMLWAIENNIDLPDNDLRGFLREKLEEHFDEVVVRK